MTNKSFWLGTLALVFGMTIVGCTNSSLNGTWVNTDEYSNQELKMKTGKFEYSFDGALYSKGTYIIRDKTFISTATHIYGSSYSDLLESKWYTKAAVKASDWKVEYIDELFDEFTETFSLSGNELTFTAEIDGETYTNTYTKKQEEPPVKRGGKGKDVIGTWKGNYEGFDVTITITTIGWTISVPDAGYADTGTYEMDGVHGRLTSDSNGRVVGTAEIINKKTLNITLNQSSVAPGTHTLTKQ